MRLNPFKTKRSSAAQTAEAYDALDALAVSLRALLKKQQPGTQDHGRYTQLLERVTDALTRRSNKVDRFDELQAASSQELSAVRDSLASKQQELAALQAEVSRVGADIEGRVSRLNDALSTHREGIAKARSAIEVRRENAASLYADAVAAGDASAAAPGEDADTKALAVELERLLFAERSVAERLAAERQGQAEQTAQACAQMDALVKSVDELSTRAFRIEWDMKLNELFMLAASDDGFRQLPDGLQLTVFDRTRIIGIGVEQWGPNTPRRLFGLRQVGTLAAAMRQPQPVELLAELRADPLIAAL